MGIPKDYYWLLRSIFRSDPIVHGIPPWTWPGKEGDNIPFREYSNCDEIEILVNGQQATDSPRLPVKVHMVDVDGSLVYAPGTVLVRGYRDGNMVTEHRQATAGAPAGIRLIPDRRALDSQLPRDLNMVRIAIVDTAGTFFPCSSSVVRLSVDGPARLIGSQNGNPLNDADNVAATTRISMFYGQAATILESIEMTGDASIVYCLCSPSTWDLLNQDFLTYVYPLIPAVHTPTFLSSLEAHRTIPHGPFACLQTSIFAIVHALLPSRFKHYKAIDPTLARNGGITDIVQAVFRAHDVFDLNKGPELQDEPSMTSWATMYLFGAAYASLSLLHRSVMFRSRTYAIMLSMNLHLGNRDQRATVRSGMPDDGLPC
jgi:hypothetical protein